MIRARPTLSFKPVSQVSNSSERRKVFTGRIVSKWILTRHVLNGNAAVREPDGPSPARCWPRHADSTVAGHARYTAVLDACVLYPVAVADSLMSVAATGLFAAKWTKKIEEEWIRSLERERPDLQGKLSYRSDQMRVAADIGVCPGRYWLGAEIRKPMQPLLKVSKPGKSCAIPLLACCGCRACADDWRKVRQTGARRENRLSVGRSAGRTRTGP